MRRAIARQACAAALWVSALTTCGLAGAAQSQLPDWSGWWGQDEPGIQEYLRNPSPLLPQARRDQEAALLRDDRPYCQPTQFTGYVDGFVSAVEFLFTPGRVTLTSERGLIRRIYTDGRRLPDDPPESGTGISVGHWEGQTLVVETVGIQPDANYPHAGQIAIPVGRNVRIVERIRLVDADTLEFDVLTIAPEILASPDRRVRSYRRLKNYDFAQEWTSCASHDRAVDPVTGKQRFDMTPPADLPPPP